MLITIPTGLQIYYEVKGEGEPLFLLHGWGGSSQSMRVLLNYFSKNYRVYSLDIPGFGRSGIPLEVWGSREYAQCIWQTLQQLNINSCNVIAHSFGGRIAIVLAAEHPELIKKMVLTGSAGLLPVRGLDYYVKVYTAKFTKRALSLAGDAGKKIHQNIVKRLGSADYSAANPQMRSILVKVVNEDLTDFLPRIKTPTLLVWGEKDTATPLVMGQKMNQLIAGSRLIVIPCAGHFAYLEKTADFCLAASAFIQSIHKI